MEISITYFLIFYNLVITKAILLLIEFKIIFDEE